MKKTTKKNAWIVNLVNENSNSSLRRITIPREALVEAEWNLDNGFYIANYIAEYGFLELTQDGRQKDINRSYTISKCNGYPVVQVSFCPFAELTEKTFYRAAVEADANKGSIYVTPLIF
jgi:hypothetical protein